MHLELNQIPIQQLCEDLIEKKWDANWWRKYWKSTHKYGVGKIKLEKKQTQKNTFMCLFILEWDKQILNWDLVGWNTWNHVIILL